MKNRGMFGNVMYMDTMIPYTKKMAIYLSGPAVNIAIAVAGLIISSKTDGKIRHAAEIAAYSNIMLGAFNMLPFYPLDGGRAVMLIFSRIFGENVSMGIAGFFSRIFAVSVFIYGVYLVKYNLMNIILIFDAIYFLYIFERESYVPYG